MAQKSSGSAHGTRHKFARNPDDTTTVNDHMKEFEEGEQVLIKYDASVQSGRSHQRFYGKNAEVAGFRGDAVELEVKDGNKVKTLFLKPVHLQKTEE
ncbi:MAG: 50S ribosomal protein L21e [Candidatus Nanohaloarchaea archaeon]